MEVTRERPAVRENLVGIMPDRVKRLPVDRGYPVPWFVPWIDGRPEFRVADAGKRRRAIVERLCWVCGDVLGRFVSFVVGPMCSVNRVSSDPPAHRDCAEFAVRACPFLINPDMDRRPGGLPEDLRDGPGVMLAHNPGACLVWTTRAFSIDGGLFHFGDPEAATWWREGRPATLAEVLAAFAIGFPKLHAMATAEGPAAVAELTRLLARAEVYLPAAEDLGGGEVRR